MNNPLRVLVEIRDELRAIRQTLDAVTGNRARTVVRRGSLQAQSPHPDDLRMKVTVENGKGRSLRSGGDSSRRSE